MRSYVRGYVQTEGNTFFFAHNIFKSVNSPKSYAIWSFQSQFGHMWSEIRYRSDFLQCDLCLTGPESDRTWVWPDLSHCTEVEAVAPSGLHVYFRMTACCMWRLCCGSLAHVSVQDWPVHSGVWDGPHFKHKMWTAKQKNLIWAIDLNGALRLAVWR